MKLFTTEIIAASDRSCQLVDITERVRAQVARSQVRNGLCSLYAQAPRRRSWSRRTTTRTSRSTCSTAWPRCARWPLAARSGRPQWGGPPQGWHRGPSESIPIRDGQLGLSTWQNVFLCDFDGPRTQRRVLLTIVGE